MFSVGTSAQGFALTMSLIVAIGAQNALLLTQAIRNQHQWLMAVIFIAIDIVLMSSGVLGLGAVLKVWPDLLNLFKWGGALFLFVYGCQAYQQSNRENNFFAGENLSSTRKKIILTALAVSLLNPHVYLDTVMLIGGIGAQLQLAERYSFLIGAGLASTCWFVCLCLTGRFLQPLFSRSVAWKVLYRLVALTMWGIAAVLIISSTN